MGIHSRALPTIASLFFFTINLFMLFLLLLPYVPHRHATVAFQRRQGLKGTFGLRPSTVRSYLWYTAEYDFGMDEIYLWCFVSI